MIGIGGASMRGLCRILLDKGMAVSGSDLAGCCELERLGVRVFKTHDAINIGADTHVVIYSSAVKKDNPELLFAQKSNMCVFSRGELLGLVSRGYKDVVAISGSHGKTTTTAMLASVLAFADINATVHFGSGEAFEKIGNGDDVFLCEACEYQNNFLHLNPKIGVILNAEFDHPDFFQSEMHMLSSFYRFAKNCKLVVTTPKVQRALNLQNALCCKVESEWESETTDCSGESLVEIKDCSWGCSGIKTDCGEECSVEIKDCCEFQNHNAKITFVAKNLQQQNGVYTFEFHAFGKFVCDAKLSVAGFFNVENALFALACGYLQNISPARLEKGISSFCGVKRRLETVGVHRHVSVISDYAHHPTQISEIANLFAKTTQTSGNTKNAKPVGIAQNPETVGDAKNSETVGDAKNSETVGDAKTVGTAQNAKNTKTTETAQNAETAENFSEVIVIFQPHTYSRTEALLKEFASALEKFPTVIITTTYPAREPFSQAGCAETLASITKTAVFCAENILVDFIVENHIQNCAENKKTFIFMGAGNSDIHAKEFLRKISTK